MWTSGETKRLLQLRDGESLSFGQIGLLLEKTTNACKNKYKREKARKEKKHAMPDFPDLASPEVDLDNWLEELGKLQELILDAQPHTIVATVKIRSGGQPIAFMPTSCWHIGGLYTFHDKFREKFNELLQVDRLYWGSLGDEWEGFPPNWASTVFNNLVNPTIQKQLIWKIIKRLAKEGKLLFSCWSNHPAFMQRRTGEDPAAQLYYRAEIPYFNARGIVKLYVDGMRYILDVAHDFKGASMYNPNHQQGREMRSFPYADMIISSHKHQYSYQEYHVNGMALEAGLTQNNMARLVNVGSTKAGPDPYTVRGWGLGQFTFDSWPCFIFSAKRHAIHQVHDLDAVKWYLEREDY